MNNKEFISKLEGLKKIQFYKGLLSKSDCWHYSGDVLCDKLEEAMHKELDKIISEMKEQKG